MNVCAVGHCAKVIYYKIKDLYAEDLSIVADDFTVTYGHDALNVCYALGKLGINSYLASNSINDSDFANLQFLESYQVDFSLFKHGIGIHTPTTVMLEDICGNRKFITDKNISFSGMEFNDIIESNFDYYYLDMYDETCDEAFELISILSEQNKKIYVNISSSSFQMKIHKLAKNVKIDVLQTGFTGKQPEVLLDKIYNHVNAKAVVLTCGKFGSYIKTKDNYNHSLPPYVNPMNNIVGTGAFFSAGFLYALVKGMGYIEANDYAVNFVSDYCKNVKQLFLFGDGKSI